MGVVGDDSKGTPSPGIWKPAPKVLGQPGGRERQPEGLGRELGRGEGASGNGSGKQKGLGEETASMGTGGTGGAPRSQQAEPDPPFITSGDA